MSAAEKRQTRPLADLVLAWARTSGLMFVRQALSPLSYSPVRQIRDKGSNLDLHVQSVASCRLDDPGAPSVCLSVHLPVGDRRSRHAPGRPWSRPMTRSAEAERCFPSHSPTLRPWIADRRLRIARAGGVLRGGALEPEPHTLTGKTAG